MPRRRVPHLILDTDDLDAAIRKLALDLDLEEISPEPPPPRHAACKGEVSRPDPDALRGTGET